MSTAKNNPDLPEDTDTTRDSGGTDPVPHADHAKGRPHSDRHAAETLAGRLEKRGPAEIKTK